MRRFLLSLLILGLTAFCMRCNFAENNRKKGRLIIFHAGSVSKPLREVSRLFEAMNPGVKIYHEAAGSVECARKITDLGKACDVFVTADADINKKMLWPKFVVKWYGFAHNAMVIAYTQNSKFAGKVDSSNWYDYLLRDEVTFARSDPVADPCGYRTLFVWQLAERYYEKPGLTNRFIAKNTHLIRPKETDLLMLLQSGAADYIFIYKSIAVQHDLSYVELPVSINLSDNQMDSVYYSVHYSFLNKETGSAIIHVGSVITYGAAVLQNAPNPSLARQYLDFLLSPEGGLKIFSQNGHSIPDTIREYP